jgi:hypothetical protein
MNAGEKVPVLFLFMGSNGYGDEVPQRTGWDTVADENGFIIVSPSGHVRHQGNFGNFDRNGVPVYQYCTNWRASPSGSATSILPDDLLMIDDIYACCLRRKARPLWQSMPRASMPRPVPAAALRTSRQISPAVFCRSVPCSGRYGLRRRYLQRYRHDRHDGQGTPRSPAL